MRDIGEVVEHIRDASEVQVAEHLADGRVGSG
jgi:hypothetical protein